MNLKKEYWRLISLFVRQSEADENGIVKCVSCGKLMHWKHAQAGHYYKSELYPGVRYDLRNIHCQCVACNIFREGNRTEYAKWMKEHYTKQELEELDRKKNNKLKYTKFEWSYLIEEMQDKLRALK
jgi:hypothetical protein